MFASIAMIAAPIAGAALQANAAGDAADSQSRSSSAALDEQRRQFDQARQDAAPFRDTGVAANSRMRDLLGLNTDSGKVSFKGQVFDSKDHLRQALTDDYVRQGGDPSSPQYQQSLQNELGNATQYQDPAGSGFGDSPLTRKFTMGDFYADPVTQAGLQFGLDEGTKGLNRMAAARGSLNSGAALKDLTRFGTDYAGTKANESYGRFTNDQNQLYNKLAAVSGSGQVAQQNTSSLGAQTATNVGNLISAQGNARGAASIAQGNAFSNGFNTVGNLWNQQNMVNQLTNSGAGNGYFGGPGMYNMQSSIANSSRYGM